MGYEFVGLVGVVSVWVGTGMGWWWVGCGCIFCFFGDVWLENVL